MKQFLRRKRKEIIKSSLENFGLLIKSKNIIDAIDISNELAPEHLQLSIKIAKTTLIKLLMREQFF